MARLFVASSTQYLSYAGAIVSAVPFSVSLWFYPTTLLTGGDVFCLGISGSTNQRHRIFVNSANFSVQSRTTATSSANITSPVASTGVWQHGAGVWATDADRRAFFGGATATNTTSRAPSGMDTTLIGLRTAAPNDLPWDGRLAEVGMWNVALADDDVTALSRGVNPILVRPQSLVGYWPIWGNDSPELDLKPSVATSTRFPMTVNGTPAKANHAPVTSWLRRAASAPYLELPDVSADYPYFPVQTEFIPRAFRMIVKS